MMDRRRALMRQETADSWTPIVTTWTIGRQITPDGNVVSSQFAAASDYIAVSAGAMIRNDGPKLGRNNKEINMYVHEYNGTTWLRRKWAGHNGDTVVTIGGDANNVRLTLAYWSTSGMAMRREDVDNYARPMISQ